MRRDTLTKLKKMSDMMRRAATRADQVDRTATHFLSETRRKRIRTNGLYRRDASVKMP
jgi:hypothetical protein